MQIASIDPQGALPVPAVRAKTSGPGQSSDSLFASFINGDVGGNSGDAASDQEAPVKISASDPKSMARQLRQPARPRAERKPAEAATHAAAGTSQTDQPAAAADAPPLEALPAPDLQQAGGGTVLASTAETVGLANPAPADAGALAAVTALAAGRTPVVVAAWQGPGGMRMATTAAETAGLASPAPADGALAEAVTAQAAGRTQVEAAPLMAAASQEKGGTRITAESAVATTAGQDISLPAPAPLSLKGSSTAVQPETAAALLETATAGAAGPRPLGGLTQGGQGHDLARLTQGNPSSETMDPRFAELLGKPAGGEHGTDTAIRPTPANRRSSGQGPDPAWTARAPAASQQPTALAIDVNSHENRPQGEGEKAQITAATPAPAMAATTADTGSFFSTMWLAVHQAAPQPALTNQDNGVIRLPTGTLIPEHRVIDQVVSQTVLHSLGNGASSITIRLQPEELGRLKLELQVEQNAVKAHIQAQSTQVQEVLERYLPRLREGLEQNGLRLEQLQVSVDAERRGGFGPFQEQLSSRQMFSAPDRSVRLMTPEPISVQPMLMGRSSAGGINLRI